MTVPSRLDPYIISSRKTATFLHRTFPDCLDKIMSQGLTTGYQLTMTANYQPLVTNLETLSRARGIYKNAGLDHGPAVVVIQIPEALWAEAKKEFPTAEVLHPQIGLYDEKTRTLRILPTHIKGWIDRETDRFHSNPYNPPSTD